MELMAAIKSIESLLKPFEITLVTDSTYVMNGINTWMKAWKKKGWKKIKNKALWVRLDEAMQGHKVKSIWVKGHSGHPQNERADELAGLAMDRIEK